MEYLRTKLRTKKWRMFSAFIPSMFILLVAFQNCKEQSVIVALSSDRNVNNASSQNGHTFSSTTTTIQGINENIAIPDMLYIKATSSAHPETLDPTISYADFPIGASVDLELVASEDQIQNAVYFRWGIKSIFLSHTHEDNMDQKTTQPLHTYTFSELGVYNVLVTPVEQSGFIENQNITDPLIIHDGYRVWDPIYKTIIIGQCENDNVEILSESLSTQTNPQSPSSTESSSSSQHYINFSINSNLELLDMNGVLIETTPSDILWQITYDEEVMEASDQSITIDLLEYPVPENLLVDLFVKPTAMDCIIHKTQRVSIP